jgi:hypothetical protein
MAWYVDFEVTPLYFIQGCRTREPKGCHWYLEITCIDKLLTMKPRSLPDNQQLRSPSDACPALVEEVAFLFRGGRAEL